jgi:hypothetical protein
MWPNIFKAALVTGLVIGLLVLIIAGLRRSRANRGNPNWFQRPGGQPSHVASIHGTMPNTPLPERINWDNDNDPDHEQ